MPPWKLAEDAVVRGDAETLAALLREHGDALRLEHASTWSGGLAPSYADGEAQAIIAREHFFDSWDAFASFAAARRDPRSPIARFEAAAEAIVDGDLETLTRLLREDPELVRARSARRHHATLFHYVGSNGIEGFRQRAPKNLVAIAAALLDAGADVNATAQMYGARDTTLLLAATSIHPVLGGRPRTAAHLPLRPRRHGRRRPGGLVGRDQRLPRQRPPGRRRRSWPARADALDLEAAAGVGRLDLVAACFTPDGRLKPPATEKQLNNGFMWACEYGRTDVVSLLLAKGMPVGAKGRTNGQTGLHWAAWEGHVDTLQVLLDAGAPVDTRDDTYGGTRARLGPLRVGWRRAAPGRRPLLRDRPPPDGRGRHAGPGMDRRTTPPDDARSGPASGSADARGAVARSAVRRGVAWRAGALAPSAALLLAARRPASLTPIRSTRGTSSG